MMMKTRLKVGMMTRSIFLLFPFSRCFSSNTDRNASAQFDELRDATLIMMETEVLQFLLHLATLYVSSYVLCMRFLIDLGAMLGHNPQERIGSWKRLIWTSLMMAMMLVMTMMMMMMMPRP
jgi:hypothetical protein